LANILIVDDDIAVQAVVRLLLERDGHEVVVAGDGLKGLKIFETGKFDLLIVDIFMPGTDGLETMRLVHQQKTGHWRRSSDRRVLSSAFFNRHSRLSAL
jgi:CheY-like chemotaxis protein